MESACLEESETFGVNEAQSIANAIKRHMPPIKHNIKEYSRGSARTKIEHREVAADDAAADRLALALAGAAGAVAVRRGEACGVGRGMGRDVLRTSCCRA